MANQKSSSKAVALPAEISGAIDRLRERYPTSEALLLPALHLAQKHWDGWLPNEAIEAVARELDLAPARVYGVVTFYDLYHQSPVGRHRVRICTNISCALRGANEVLQQVEQNLGVGEGEVTPDGRCSFVQFECLGACEQAPMMMVDDDYVGNLTPERAVEVLEKLT
jgi:NADH-quinone oxidoreductase subunit E